MNKGKLKSRRDIIGWIFILPWFIGLIFFFLQPLISLLRYSFTDFKFTDDGYVLGKINDGIFAHYVHALTQDAQFPQFLLKAVTSLMYQVPVVVFFCLFTAMLLKHEFHGRTVMRTIFFLPIIITSGVLSEIIRRDSADIALVQPGGATNIFDVSTLTQQMLNSGIPQGITTFLTQSVTNVADLVWSSGIQILIFLAALLAIPSTYYEVAQVEGASGWETFWKVTFPIVSPFMLVNLIYTIIDSFTSYSNKVMRYITTYFNVDLKFSYAAAMAWIYFVVILLILGLVFLLFRRMVFYNNK